MAERLAEALGPLPALGPTASIRRVPPGDLDGVRGSFADEPYREGGPALRVAATDGPPHALLMAAHHGALDGLGLVALLGVLLGTPVSSSAKGLGERPGGGSFARVVVRRLAEAAFRPPARVAPASRRRGAPGDELAAVDVSTESFGTSALVAASLRAVRGWNARLGGEQERLVVAVGASRRAGDGLRLEERSAYLRFPVTGLPDEDRVRQVLRRTPPQPPAPAMAGLGPAAALVRAVSGRLGSTLLVSHLGTLKGPPELRSVAFYPVAHGRSGVAVGAACVREVTTLTLRARRRDFDRSAAEALLAAVARQLSRDSPGPSGTG
jgi:hypothetical protein